MIHRVWHGWAVGENADAYERLVREEVLPGIAAKGIAGYGGAWLARRRVGDEVEFTTTLRFDSMDAVRQMAGADAEASYVPAPARAVLARWDERAAHYEVLQEPSDAVRASGPTLATALRRAITGPMWHGPALRESVEGVSAAQAAARPVPGAHGIWELVAHVGAWAEIVLERLEGRAEEVTPERNFPPVREATEEVWQATVAAMERAYAALAEAVEGLDDGALARVAVAGQPPAGVMIRGVVEHGVYHAGQISLLRRALGIEPPPS